MRIIKNLVDCIDAELEDAKKYAESYVEYRVRNDNNWAARYKEMAQDELKHATYLHELAVQKIRQIETLYKAPEEMQKAWEESHAHYVEREAWIKQMLSL